MDTVGRAPQTAAGELAKSGPKLLVGLGELLWDQLPGGQQLGGAPANFAYHASGLGNRGLIASRIGSDGLGRQAVERLHELELDSSYLQIDETHPTGLVRVELDESGQPAYSIRENVAWDFLEWTDRWHQLAEEAHVVCFGSLAQRFPQSRRTIRCFLEALDHDCLSIFDVNLRQSYYSAESVSQSLQLAKVLKVSEEERSSLSHLLHLNAGSGRDWARQVLRDYGLELVCITRAAQGCLLVTESEWAEHPGFPVRVADAVGAGDAFTAALSHQLLRGRPLRRIAETANCLGAWVASQVGAMPAIPWR
ncbi:MAG: carbohydrate kinase [Acidobacteriota bacterium]